MSTFIPPIVSVDYLVDKSKNAPIITINHQPYISDHTEGVARVPYYSNIVKRIVAAFYVLQGKGIVVQYSLDAFKASEIETITYE